MPFFRKSRMADIPPGADSPLASAIEQRDRSTLDIVTEAVRHRHAMLAYQPVFKAQPPQDVAFYEGLVRILDEAGRPIVDPERGMKTLEQGAATSVWCATSPQLNGMGGVYCEDCDVAVANEQSVGRKGVSPWACDRDSGGARRGQRGGRGEDDGTAPQVARDDLQRCRRAPVLSTELVQRLLDEVHQALAVGQQAPLAIHDPHLRAGEGLACGIGDPVVGVVGAFLGNILGGMFGMGATLSSFNPIGLLWAFIGALVLLAIVNMVRRGRVR